MLLKWSRWVLLEVMQSGGVGEVARFGNRRWWCCSGVGVVGDGDGDGYVLEGVSGAVLVLDFGELTATGARCWSLWRVGDASGVALSRLEEVW